MTALLHASPVGIASPLCEAILEPILRTLQSAVSSSGHGVQGQLLTLAYAAITLGPVQGLMPDLLVQTVSLGLAAVRSPDWAHWVSFSVSCLPCCAGSRSTDAAASLVVALLTILSDLLLSSDPPLPPPQLEALLVALQHSHHFCLFGQPPVPFQPTDGSQPPRTPSQATQMAQHAMHQQMPVVVLALLHTWHAASPADVYTRQLAQAPLALLSRHGASRRELLESVVFVWERKSLARPSASSAPASGDGGAALPERDGALLAFLAELPACSPAQVRSVARPSPPSERAAWCSPPPPVPSSHSCRRPRRSSRRPRICCGSAPPRRRSESRRRSDSASCSPT